MTEHLNQLAKDLGATIQRGSQFSSKPVDVSGGCAKVPLKLICLGARPNHKISYFVGLHELGHIAHNDKGSWTSRGISMIFKEIRAWSWALIHATEFPDKLTLKFMCKCLLEYIEFGFSDRAYYAPLGLEFLVKLGLRK
jgi:hypothetical protein